MSNMNLMVSGLSANTSQKEEFTGKASEVPCKETKGLIGKLSSYLFWDCNADMLDPDADQKLIVERVFSRGTENDEKEIFSYYGKESIRNAVVDIRYLDKKVLNYLSIVFHLPKDQFRCYKQSLSENPFGIF